MNQLNEKRHDGILLRWCQQSPYKIWGSTENKGCRKNVTGSPVEGPMPDDYFCIWVQRLARI